MRKKNFVGSSNDVLQAVLHEGLGRKGLSIKTLSGTHDLESSEDQPVVAMYDPNHFVPVSEIPESLEDAEEILIEMIDEKIELAHEESQILPFAGNKPQFNLPGRVVKMVKRVIHPERKSGMTAACYNASTGVLLCVY